jgi:hypothetical protein
VPGPRSTDLLIRLTDFCVALAACSMLLVVSVHMYLEGRLGVVSLALGLTALVMPKLYVER